MTKLCEHGNDGTKVFCLLCYRRWVHKLDRRKCGNCKLKRLVQWDGKQHTCLACLRLSK